MSGATDRRIRGSNDLAGLRFDDRGLVPMVVQDVASGEVLMVAWANREALERTLESGEVHFWSRSRDELWRKGATSGNILHLRSLHADCDGDALLAVVAPSGPACHTGDGSCFGEMDRPGDTLGRLWRVLESRDRARPEGSYTTRLLEDENLRLKKMGEEGAELLAALARNDGQRIPQEAADLLYHLLVALRASGSGWDEVLAVLEDRRHGR